MINSAQVSLDPSASLTPDAVAAAMYARDVAAQSLGIRLDGIGHGSATMSMTVRPDMIQGHGTCHGGMIFTLADTAFAYACNSENQATVAAGANIEFLKPAYAGERLSAVACHITQAGRTGIYDILVRNQQGEAVASFRGKSATIKGQVIAAGEGP